MDNFNQLHFYFIDKFRDAYWCCTTTSESGGSTAPARSRAASISAPREVDVPAGRVASCTFPLTNTHQPAPASSTPTSTVSQRPRRAATARSLSRTPSPREGERHDPVEVHATRTGGSGGTTLSLTAKSETDSSKTDTATCALSAADSAPSTGEPRQQPARPLHVYRHLHRRRQTRLFSNVDVSLPASIATTLTGRSSSRSPLAASRTSSRATTSPRCVSRSTSRATSLPRSEAEPGPSELVHAHADIQATQRSSTTRSSRRSPSCKSFASRCRSPTGARRAASTRSPSPPETRTSSVLVFLERVRRSRAGAHQQYHEVQ